MVKRKNIKTKEEWKDLIYKTFFDLVLKNGYDKVSTNLIAEVAQISVGIIYKHFPKGKPDIIRKYFEKSKDIVINMDSFKQFNSKNPLNFFQEFITNDLNYHKKELGYHLGFMSAIQTDIALLENHRQHIKNICSDLVKNLRDSNEFFNSIDEEILTERFIFIYNLIDAVLFHHLFIMRLFDKDEKLIEYLSNVIVFSTNYFSEENNK